MSVVRTTVSIPEELYTEIKKEANRQKMSISKFVAASLEELLILQRKKKVANEVLEMVKTDPLSPEDAQIALKELKKLKKEWA